MVPLVVGMIAAGCGSDDTEPVADVQPDLVADEVAADVSFTPGELATGEIEIDGTTVEYVTITPDGFAAGDTAPVVLALPPGGQDFGVTRRVAEGTYLDEAVSRGWVVVSPAAPNGELFFRGSEAVIPGLLDWMQGWVSAEGGAPHIIGVSNGGISSFRAVATNPGRFSSLLVFPGFASDDDQGALESIANIPVRMFVGETDTGWVESMQDTLETLTRFGGDATLEIVPGAGHIIDELSDGVRIFDELDMLRQ